MTIDGKFLKAATGLAILLYFWTAAAWAQQESLTDGVSFPKQYMVQMSGSVLGESFSGVRALLTITPPKAESLNEYSVTIIGYPSTTQRNSFYWDSDQGTMDVVSDEVVCMISKSYVKPSDIHFFYLSPVLLKNPGATTPSEKERMRQAEKEAKPTKIFAQAGELRLKATADQVSGMVWLKGYDAIEHSYVQYAARFVGRNTTILTPRRGSEK